MSVFIVIILMCSAVSIEGRNYRLPTSAEPFFYSIQIYPDLDEGTFSGEVSIQVKINSLVKSIVLHSSNLTITDVYLDQLKENVIYELDPALDFIEISYEDQTGIPPGNHIVHIKYNGSMTEKYMGFFKARFTDKEEISYLAATDFQPTFARTAFPCFDEPAFKAQFQVTLIAPNNTYTALSNMRRIAKFETSYGVVHKFETSFPMSTYLVAFAITQYTYGEYVMDSGDKQTPIRIYSFNASDDANAKPLHFVAQFIEFFTNYTQFSYPLPKLDLIEYDRNHTQATENWGLVTTRRGFLSPNQGIFHEAQIFALLAHEVAHFWFGDLVTNYWWDDIWLQEGFAVFMSFKAEKILLDNTGDLHFINHYGNEIYALDQKTLSSPVVRFLKAPSDIRKHFSDITYVKGGALLLMTEMVLGEEKFRTAIQIYIKRFAYKTATTNDLVSIFQSLEPDADLRGFMESYIYQNRYPIIQVEEDEEQNVYILKQISCTFMKNDTETPFGYKWTIPITYITNLEKEQKLVWFHKEMDRLIIPKNEENWIKFNHKQIGYYHVNYSHSLQNKFINHSEEIVLYEKPLLIIEAVQLYLFDIIPCEVALRYLETFNINNTVTLPLQSMWMFLQHARFDFQDSEAIEILEAFMNVTLKKAHLKLRIRSTEKKIRNDNNTITKDSDDENIPQKIKLCANWIKTNLFRYLETMSDN